MEVKGKNVHVNNSNLLKHLTTTHASAKLMAKNTDTSTTTNSLTYSILFFTVTQIVTFSGNLLLLSYFYYIVI